MQMLPTGLHLSPKLCTALSGQEEAVKQRLRRNRENAALLSEVRDIVKRQLVGSAQAQLPPASFYELLVTELDAVGWSALHTISPALDEVQLQLHDAAGREHAIVLALPSDYPRSAPRVRTTLPSAFDITWPHDVATGSPLYSLNAAMELFGVELAKHQLLWDMLDDIDANAWVRVIPSTRAVHRSVLMACSRSLVPIDQVT